MLETRLKEYIKNKITYKKMGYVSDVPLEIKYNITEDDKEIIRAFISKNKNKKSTTNRKIFDRTITNINNIKYNNIDKQSFMDSTQFTNNNNHNETMFNYVFTLRPQEFNYGCIRPISSKSFTENINKRILHA